ncbi:hypothetical protein GJ496_001593 [Pomphorhynchus laevis]|nr:hypothetical protein GJ496_001593 [Pomphorhynchus laevis]
MCVASLQTIIVKSSCTTTGISSRLPMLPEITKLRLYGIKLRAKLIALKKPDSGLCPIAIVNVLRRLIAKVACYRVTPEATHLLSPKQVGVGTTCGAEAAGTRLSYANQINATQYGDIEIGFSECI